MGNDPSKKGKEKATHPKIVSKGKNSSKNLRLLILHEAESKPPIDAVDHFCDALNACKPPGSLEIKQEGVKILELDGSSSLSGSFLAEAKNWIIEWLDKDGVVLICLLSIQVKTYTLSQKILISKEGRSWRSRLENVRPHGRNVFL